MLARNNLSPISRPPHFTFLYTSFSPELECFLSLLPFSPNNYILRVYLDQETNLTTFLLNSLGKIFEKLIDITRWSDNFFVGFEDENVTFCGHLRK